jgi:hypothetical protein
MSNRYQARCTFGTQVGCTKDSACGRIVARGHLMCDDHESAVVVPVAMAYRSIGYRVTLAVQPVLGYVAVASMLVVFSAWIGA